MNNIMIHPTPIPIETCLTFNDAKRDDKQFNRYWFDFPADWITSNNNEKIIGIRSIYLLKSRRRFEYKLCVRKYYKDDFVNVCKELYPSFTDYDNAPTDIIRACVVKMQKDDKIKNKISEIEIPITSWLPIEKDLREVSADMFKVCKSYMDKYNSYLAPTTLQPKFCISADDPLDRDVQMDGGYINDKTEFINELYSPRNHNQVDPYYVDMCFTYMNTDFKEIFNISDIPNDSTSNYEYDYRIYSRRFEFHNLWDRHSLKIYSSIASQSNNNYVGHSDIHFNPIKYYKINSTDTRFWIEFYSGRQPKASIKLPNGESFFIELQLEGSQKLLYI